MKFTQLHQNLGVVGLILYPSPRSLDTEALAEAFLLSSVLHISSWARPHWWRMLTIHGLESMAFSGEVTQQGLHKVVSFSFKISNDFSV